MKEFYLHDAAIKPAQVANDVIQKTKAGRESRYDKKPTKMTT